MSDIKYDIHYVLNAKLRFSIKLFVFFAVIVTAFTIGSCKKNETGPVELTVPEINSISGFTSSIYASWLEVPGAKKYEVNYSQMSDMSISSSEEISSANIEIAGLKSATNYYLRIRAYNGADWTDWSDIKEVKTATFSATITTYNILGKVHDSKFPNNTWATRREAVRDIILQSSHNPDIFGIQEGMDISQVNEVVNLLKSTYTSHVSSRDITARAIFWKPEKFELISFDDDIDLYDGTVSGRSNQRYPTFVHLREKQSGKSLLVFNIHPRAGATADEQRVRGVVANTLSAKAKQMSIDANNAPVVILGDYNSRPGTYINGLPPTSAVFTSNGFTDTYTLAVNKINADYNTADDIETGVVTKAPDGGGRIDFIFIFPASKIAVSEYETVINFEPNSTTVMQKPVPSDHRPVKSIIHFQY